MPFYTIGVESGEPITGGKLTLTCNGSFQTRAEARAASQNYAPTVRCVIVEAENIEGAFTRARERVVAIACCLICGDDLPSERPGCLCAQCADDVWEELHRW